MFFCISMYFLMKVAARSAEKFKTLQFVVSSLQKKPGDMYTESGKNDEGMQ